MHADVRHSIHWFKRERELKGLYTFDSNHPCSKLNTKCRKPRMHRDDDDSTMCIFEIPRTSYIFSGCTLHGRYHICGDLSDPCTLVEVCSETGNMVCQMSGRYLGGMHEPTYKDQGARDDSVAEFRAGNSNFDAPVIDYGDADVEDEDDPMLDIDDESRPKEAHGKHADDRMDIDDEDDDDARGRHMMSALSESSATERRHVEMTRYKKPGLLAGMSQFDFLLSIIPKPPVEEPPQLPALIRFRALPRPIDPLPLYEVMRSSPYIKNRLAISKCLGILSGRTKVNTSIDTSHAKRVNALLCPAVISTADVIYTDKCASIATAAIVQMFSHPEMCDEHNASCLLNLKEHITSTLNSSKNKMNHPDGAIPGLTELDKASVTAIETFIDNMLRASLELLKSGYRLNRVPIVDNDPHLRDLLLIACIDPKAKRSQRKTRHDLNTTKPEKKDAENAENQLKICLNHMVKMYGADFTRSRILEFCDVHDPNYGEKLVFSR
jgi:hypothetical protein